MNAIEQAVEALHHAAYATPSLNIRAKCRDAMAALQSMQGEAVGEVSSINNQPIVYWDKSLPVGTKLYTQPQSSAAPEWKLTQDELPSEGVPVIGFSSAWIDDDFNPEGIRECFRCGDGSDWYSSWWNDPCDQYETQAGRTGHHGAPTHWMARPSSEAMLAASGKGE